MTKLLLLTDRLDDVGQQNSIRKITLQIADESVIVAEFH